MSKSQIPLFFTQQGSEFTLSTGKVVGLFAGLMTFHGLLVSGILTVPPLNAYRCSKNCLPTKYLARLTSGFVFVNLGGTTRGFSIIMSACRT